MLALSHIISTVYAACDDAIGCITPPDFINSGIDRTGKLTGVMVLMNNLLRLLFVGAGLWAFVNIILAGFGFMTAGGDPKNFSKAWDRIWQTMLGLMVIVISFLFAAVMGVIFFKDPTALLAPKL